MTTPRTDADICPEGPSRSVTGLVQASESRMPRTLPDPRTTPTMPVQSAGRLFGFGKTKSYEEAHRYLQTDGREGLPALRFGRSMVCPTAAVLKLLGIDPRETT